MELYTAVVENRLDPLRLGRCQVRVVGLHTENKSLLPTEDLPWAFPIQPITSAAISGIGNAPVGPVEGTWVVVCFRDVEQQQPLILGTIGGIPQQEVITNIEDDSITLFSPQQGGSKITTSQGSSITTPEGQHTGVPDTPATPFVDKFLGPFELADWTIYKNYIGQVESSSVPGGLDNFTPTPQPNAQNYGTINTIGFVGKYQFGAIAFADLGYLSDVCSNRQLPTTNLWTGKNKVKTLNDFINSSTVQEDSMFEFSNKNYKRLKNSIKVIKDPSNKAEVAGWLAVCHNGGYGACIQLANGIDTTDQFNTSRRQLFENAYALFANGTPAPQNLDPNTNTATPVGDTANGSLSQGIDPTRVLNFNFGFRDPNTVYPLKEFLNEPDTNRLGRGISDGTIVDVKDTSRDRGIPIAGGGSWDQPKIPFNAKYPFNHVWQSESGHVKEYDDTPQNERIHEYHKSGTYTEIDVHGTRVDFIVGDNYEIINRNGFIHIKGKCNITVDGDCNLLVNSNANIEVHGDTKANIAGELDIATGKSLKIKAKDITLESDGNIDLHGNVRVSSFQLPTGYKVDPTNLGSIATPGTTGLSSPSGTPANPNFPILQTPERDMEEIAQFESPDENNIDDNGADFFQSLQEDGEVVDRPNTIVDTTPSAPNNAKKIPANCDVIFSMRDFPRDFQLTTNWNYNEIVNPQHQLVDQICMIDKLNSQLVSKQEIMCNLKTTTENILEPILTVKRKSEFKVTSSYRQIGILARGSKTSDHYQGKAVDIQLTGANQNSASAHYQFAQLLQTMLAYDQLLLEYRDTAHGRVVWLHISYHADKSRNQALTMVNDRVYTQGLVLVS